MPTPETEEGIKKAWDYLRAEITDKKALKQLNRSVYGVDGLTDVADWFLWERLESSGLRWELVIDDIKYLGSEVRKLKSGNSTYDQTFYLVSAVGTLVINGRPFPCAGAGENRRLDAAYKGAITSLFKNGCKWAGLTMSVYKGSPVEDDYFDMDEATNKTTQSRSATMGQIPATSSTANPMAAVERAVELLDGKVVDAGTITSAQTPVQPADRLTAEKFNENPINAVRTGILEEFNKLLPRPNAGAWPGAMINLWLVKNEQNQLTEEMKKKETGGSPINYTFQLLVAAHYQQCGKNCVHVQEFHQRLISATADS